MLLEHRSIFSKKYLLSFKRPLKKVVEEEETGIRTQTIPEVELNPWSLIETTIYNMNLGPTDRMVHNKGEKLTKLRR